MRMRRVIILLIALTMFILPLFSFIQPTNAEWWDSDWQYYKVCNIDNNGYSGYYQMKINLSYDDTLDGGENVTLDSHCNANFSDIRFVDIDNSTELPYWIEKKVDSDYALVWVNVSADAMSDGKILMYYGNSSATDASDGDNTFLFFDDFDGSSLSSDWWERLSSGSYSVSNGRLTVTGGSGAWESIDCHVQFSYNTAWRLKFYSTEDVDRWIVAVNDRSNTGSYIGSGLDEMSIIYNSYDGRKYRTIVESTTTYISRTYDHSVVTISEMRWLSNNVSWYENDTYAISTTNAHQDKSGWSFEVKNTNAQIIVYWCLIRNYTSSEPSWNSFGSEKTQSGWINPPSPFTATTVSSSRIDLTWTKNNSADTTYIERNTVVTWNRGEGTLIYNSTGTSYSDTGLDPDTTYYYQAWSYNATDNTYSATSWTAIDLDGANDDVRVPDDSSLNLTSSFTIDMALWMEDTPADGKYDTIISKMTDASTGWGVGLYSNGTNWELMVCVDGHNESVGTAAIPTNEWIYPAVVFNNSTHTMHVYINGNEIYSYSEPNTPSANTADVVIGECSYVGNDKTFDGKMNYIRVYNKALTEQQIKYNFYWKDNDCTKDGLVSWWKFNENTGTTASDSWGSNDGTLEDGTTWANGTVEIFSSDSVTTSSYSPPPEPWYKTADTNEAILLLIIAAFLCGIGIISKVEGVKGIAFILSGLFFGFSAFMFENTLYMGLCGLMGALIGMLGIIVFLGGR